MPETMSSTLVVDDELDELRIAELDELAADLAFEHSSAERKFDPNWRRSAEYFEPFCEIQQSLDVITTGSGKNQRTQIVKSHENTALVFSRDPILQYIGVSTMSGRPAWRKLPPWRTLEEDLPWLDNRDLAEIDRRVCEYWGGGLGAISKGHIENARVAYAGSNKFSQWRDFVTGLPAWDGVERISTCIPTVRGIGTPYVSQKLTNFFLSMMERIYCPGCAADVVLVLYGGQGVRKTSWFRGLTPEEMPIAELSVIPDAARETDALIAVHSAPGGLIDEIDKLRTKDDQSAMKAFLSGRRDTFRAPYDRVPETHNRSFFLGGTTNKEEYLIDLTGNRRFATLTVEDVIPAEYLARAWMDLLLAEARDRYRAGERACYDGEYGVLADEVRAAHLDDPVGVEVHNWLADPRGSVGPVDVSMVSVQMIIKHCDAFGGMNAARNNHDKVTADKICLALDNHPDYQRVKGRPRVDGQQVRRAWQRTTPAPAPRAPAPVSVPDVATRAAAGFIPAPPAPTPSGSGSFDASEQWGETVFRLIAERDEKKRQWEEANR